MNFVINVAHRVGNRITHLFATADHSITDNLTAQFMLSLLKAKFPESEGYKVELFKREVSHFKISE